MSESPPTCTLTPEDPMIRWRNYQHLIWSQQQIHIQIQQQQQILQQQQERDKIGDSPDENQSNGQISSTSFTSDEGEEENTTDMSDNWEQMDSQSELLGEVLSDKNQSYDGQDFKLEYVDLEHFLIENGIRLNGNGRKLSSAEFPSSVLGLEEPNQPLEPSFYSTSPESGLPTDSDYGSTKSYEDLEIATNHLDYTISASSTPSPISRETMTPDSTNSSQASPDSTSVPNHEFDPRVSSFSIDELKPQPMVTKSKKQYVPDDAKDSKYWMRRRKNNMAAKRSRDARRVKENQIALRAGYLEKENHFIRQELERIQNENSLLKEQLARLNYLEQQHHL